LSEVGMKQRNQGNHNLVNLRERKSEWTIVAVKLV